VKELESKRLTSSKILEPACWLWNCASWSEHIGQYSKSKTFTIAAVLFQSYAEKLDVLRQTSFVPKQLKPF
jgi:hypothetical protein